MKLNLQSEKIKRTKVVLIIRFVINSRTLKPISVETYGSK